MRVPWRLGGGGQNAPKLALNIKNDQVMGDSPEVADLAFNIAWSFAQLFFRKFHVPTHTPPLPSVFAGHGLTQVSPVYEGHCLPHACQRMQLGGADLTRPQIHFENAIRPNATSSIRVRQDSTSTTRHFRNKNQCRKILLPLVLLTSPPPGCPHIPGPLVSPQSPLGPWRGGSGAGGWVLAGPPGSPSDSVTAAPREATDAAGAVLEEQRGDGTGPGDEGEGCPCLEMDVDC